MSSKLTDLHGGAFIAHKLGQRHIKRYMMPSSKDLIDYINEVFSCQEIDRAFFSIQVFIEECDYSEVQIKKALKEIKDRKIFLIHQLPDHTYFILMPKAINEFHIKLLESENPSPETNNLLLNTPEIGKLKRLTNTFKKFLKGSSKIEKRSLKIENKPSKNENKYLKNFNNSGNSDYQEVSKNKNSYLDLNSLDPYIIDHQSLDHEKEKTNDDDDKLNIKNESEEEVRKQIALSLKIELLNNEDKKSDQTIKEEKISELVPVVAHPDEFKNKIKKQLIENGVQGKKLNEIINNPKDILQAEIRVKALEYQDVSKIKNVGALLVCQIQNPESYPLPFEMIQENSHEKIKQNKSKWSELCTSIGFSGSITWQGLKQNILEFKDIFTNDDELFQQHWVQFYELFMNKFNDEESNRRATNASANILKLKKDSLREKLNKILNFFGFEDNVSAKNINSVIENILKSLEVQYKEILV